MKALEAAARRIAEGVTSTRDADGCRRWIEKGEDGERDMLVIEGPVIVPGQAPARVRLPVKDPLPE